MGLLTNRTDVGVSIGADTVIGVIAVLCIVSCLSLLSGFKNWSLSWSERIHPMNLEMVTIMMSAPGWVSLKKERIESKS